MSKERKSMNELNKAQKAFCREYVLNNNNGRNAYKKAYPSKTRKDATTDVNASQLLCNPKVKQYVEELQKEAREEFSITREKQAKTLEDIINRNAKTDDRVVISALQEQAKLFGLYESSKIDLTTKGKELGGTVNIINIPDNGRDTSN